MKKFVIFIVTAIMMAVASVTANAQYAYKVPAKYIAIEQEDGQVVPLTELQEYKDAKRMRDKGMGESIAGLCAELIGLGIITLSPNFDEPEIGMFVGGIGVTIGAVVSVIGSYRWIKGETRLRDIRMAYALKGNGVVIAF